MHMRVRDRLYPAVVIWTSRWNTKSIYRTCARDGSFAQSPLRSYLSMPYCLSPRLPNSSKPGRDQYFRKSWTDIFSKSSSFVGTGNLCEIGGIDVGSTPFRYRPAKK